MSAEASRQVLIGLPKTGKTTYLAALWHLVEYAEVTTALRLTELHGDREYLNRIRSIWLSCNEIPRTSLTSEEVVSMRLASQSTESVTELTIPDLSGEIYRQLWIQRALPTRFLEWLRSASGCLLFVHPGEIVEPTRIDQALHLVAEIDGENPPTESQAQNAYPKWDPARSPTQVQLVEIIQSVWEHRKLDNPFKVSVIVSAWDLALVEGLAPDAWLERHLPLLAQHLYATIGTYRFRVYGVSAQGGQLQDSQKLLRLDHASERILISGPECGPHDLTAPVAWLLYDT
jgi:hypothetical protein